MAVAAAAGAGFFWHEQTVAARGPRDAEVEPDNTPDAATPIAPGTDVRGQFGVRLAPDRGDVDFFRLSEVPAGEWRIRVELSGVPNVDSVVELLDANRPQAIAVADDSGPGGREVIAGFRIRGGGGSGPYFLSVHEQTRPNAFPIETLSDSYGLRYTIEPIGADLETEPDDRSDLAMGLRTDATARGYLESGADVDWWCAEENAGAMEVTLEPPAGLDLEMVVHPRDGSAETVVDAAPIGGRETARLVSGASPTPCVIIRGAGSVRGEQHGNPQDTYTLRTERR
jgi:hypothetical protein